MRFNYFLRFIISLLVVLFIQNHRDLYASDVEIPGYKLIESVPGDLKDTTVYVYEHIKTGATVVYYNNPNDDNSSFRITFKIIPEDSSGVFHVLEHAICDGSVKYPFGVKKLDELYIFNDLNCKTTSDVSYYKVSSIDQKSFKELTNIFIDRVFNPLFLKDSTIFYKQGIRRVIDESGKLYNTGIAYSEQLGRQSEDIVLRAILNQSFPSGGYQYNYGGIPEQMSKYLTYEKMVETYKKYYHPSNALISFYGAVDIKERLEYFDREYLSKFEKKDKIELPISGLKSVPEGEKFQIETKYYPGEESEDPDTNRKMVIGYVNDGMSFKDREAIKILSMLIINNKVVQRGEGVYFNGKLLTLDPVASDVQLLMNANKSFGTYIIGSGIHKADVLEFISTIINRLRSIYSSIVSDPKDIEQAIKKAIEQLLLKEKEISSSNLGNDKYFPRFAAGWAYADDPLMYFDRQKILIELSKEPIKYFIDLFKKVYIKNRRSVVFQLVPDKNFLSKQQDRIDQHLEELNKKLSDEDREKIIDINTKVKELNDHQNDPELYKNIDPLTDEDIKRVSSIMNQDATSDSIILKSKKDPKGITLKVLTSDIKDESTYRIQFLYGLSHLTEEDYLYLKILEGVLLGGPKRDGENIIDGTNWKDDISRFGNVKLITEWRRLRNKVISYFNVEVLIGSKQNKPDFNNVVSLLLQGVYDTEINVLKYLLDFGVASNKLLEMKRNYQEALKESLVQLQNKIQSVNNTDYENFCIQKSSSFIDPECYVNDYLNGKSSEAATLVAKLIEDIDTDLGLNLIINRLEQLKNKIFKNNLPIITIVTSNSKNIDLIKKAVSSSKLGSYLNKDSKYNFDTFSEIKNRRTLKNRAYVIPNGSSYVVQSYDMSNYITDDNSLDYQILAVYLADTYIDKQLREVKGIAYGGTAVCYAHGISIISYKNSNIKETLDVYDNIYNFMKEKSNSITEREALGRKIRIISKIFAPRTPMEQADATIMNTVFGYSQKDYRSDIDKILNLDLSSLLSEKAEEFKSGKDNSVTTVIGGRNLIESVKDRFDEIKPIGE